MHCYALSCSSSNLVGGWRGQRTHLKPSYPKSLFAVRSSILLQRDGSGKVKESDGFSFQKSKDGSSSLSTASHPNAVGIIGGVSAVSTVNFLKKLVDWSSQEGRDSLPFIVCNDPELNRELSGWEKNPGKSCSLPEHDAVLEKLIRNKDFLRRSGAGCIVTPFHICNLWHERISGECSVPVFHVGECVAMELKEAGLKPLEAGSSCKIGILASKAIIEAEIYQEKLRNQGFEVILPDKATMEHTVLPALEALKRKDMEGARNLLRIALHFLLLRAVNTVILASDDLRQILPHDDPLLKKCVDPMDALARVTLQWFYSQENSSMRLGLMKARVRRCYAGLRAVCCSVNRDGKACEIVNARSLGFQKGSGD